MTDAPRVTVAGGGLAGITTALRLGERGYRVKLYEQKPMLGGNVASRPAGDGVLLDVYPHMLLSWYRNFWRLMKDAHVDRRGAFVEITSVKQLRRGPAPHYTALTDGYSPRRAFQNVFSGVGPPADMFLFWYSTVDLLAERLNPTMLLDDVSVTGFLHARPYMTERAAKVCDSFITMVWAIPGYLTCADDYRTYLAYSVSSYRPPCLLARGPAAERIIAPLTAALERAGVEIAREVEVTSVSCAGGRVTEVGLRRVGDGDEWTEDVDELVLAVTPQALSSLVRTGDEGQRLVDAVPRLAELARLESQRIPTVYLFFKRKRAEIPPEPVGLYDSPLALSFTDVSQTWTGVDDFGDRTVLCVSASDPYGLPGTGDEDDGHAILRELAEFVHFDAGSAWGESAEIDWARTRYDSNADSQLFLNETGFDIWRPAATCGEIANLAFAGNFCVNRIGMMTVESAVASGLEAAQAIVARRGLGDPVEIVEPDAGFDPLYVWLRYAFAPQAAAAKAWSTGSDWARGLRSLLSPGRRQRRES